MTAERFDIEVQDKVARSIRTELRAIGTEARSTFTALEQMKRELAGLSGRGSNAAASIRAEAQASRERTAAARDEARAINQVTEALRAQAAAARTVASTRGTGRGAPPVPDTPASPSPLRGAGAAAGTIASAAGVAAMNKELGAFNTAAPLARHHSINLAFQMQDLGMQMAMAAQSSRPLSMGLMALFQQGTQIQGIAMQSGMSMREMGSSMLQVAKITKRVGDAEADMAAAVAVAEAKALASRVAATEAAVMEAEVQTALARSQQAAAVTAVEAAAAEEALALADKAVAKSAAEAAIARDASAKANARAAEATTAANARAIISYTKFGRAAVAGGVAAAGALWVLYDLHKKANEEFSKDELTKGLNLSAKEMRHMQDVTVTWGDTTKAVFQVIGGGIRDAFGPQLDEAKDSIVQFFEQGDQSGREFGNSIVGHMVGAYNTLVEVWDNLPAAIADSFVSMVNAAIDEMNHLIKAAVDGVNGFISSAENAIGLDMFGTLDAPQIEKIKNKYAGAAKQVGETAQREMKKALGRDYLGELEHAITNQAGRNARSRIRDEAEKRGYLDPEKGKKPKADHTAEKRAKALADVNRELDGQIHLLGFYGDALEREQQFTQISNSLAQKKIKLTEDEAKTIKDKIAAVQAGKRVQAELNAIWEQAEEPQLKYTATLKALDKAEKDHTITADEAERQRTLAFNKLKHDSNPLYDYVKEIARAARNMGLYGSQLEIATRSQALFDKAVAAGTIKDTPENAHAFDQQAADEYNQGKMNNIFQEIDPREKAASDTTSYILDHWKDLYKNIDDLREQDVISEQEAQERKKNLDRALGDARLEAASSVFGQLASLQDSHSKEVAAIGKAAAIAQATIDGISAVQAALKGPPGPPWSFAIAAATAVATAANVAKIAGVGFQSGGYTGAGSDSEEAGLVHRNEFVFDSSATKRIGVPALEAIRKGARLGGANDNHGGGRARVTVQQHPGVAIETRERSDGEIEIIAERAVRKLAPAVVAQDLGNPNGRTSKAVSHGFGIGRSRK